MVLRFTEQGSTYAGSENRENLAQRKMDHLGRCEHPCSLACRQLRFGRVRGHSLLRHQARTRDFSVARAHAAADQLRKNLPHGAPFFS